MMSIPETLFWLFTIAFAAVLIYLFRRDEYNLNTIEKSIWRDRMRLIRLIEDESRGFDWTGDDSVKRERIQAMQQALFKIDLAVECLLDVPLDYKKGKTNERAKVVARS